jgi:hypothetical protein
MAKIFVHDVQIVKLYSEAHFASWELAIFLPFSYDMIQIKIKMMGDYGHLGLLRYSLLPVP